MSTVASPVSGNDRAGEPERSTGERDGRRRRWPFWPVVAVVIVGLLTTTALTWVSAELYSRNEKRLLRLRARDVGAVLTSALPSLQTPLASAAALADATSGDTRKFRQFVAPYVGRGSSRPFVSVSLWRVNDPHRPLAVVGAAPALRSSMARAPTFFTRASKRSTLSVIGLLGRHRLGFAFTRSVLGPFAAYGESALPAGHYTPVQKNAAFADINYALYLGHSARPSDLLVASARRLPLSGRHFTVRVPFGDTFFTVTVAARAPLAGSLPQDLPWAIAIVGALLTLGSGVLAVRLIERRRRVEHLADRLEQTAEENRDLYAQQRNIAQTLQRALLPDTLPRFPGLEVAARYEPGVEDMEVGGDWYDLIVLDEQRLLLVVGDVSGRGLRAASTMASLRFAIHAYAMQGDEPPTFLPKLSGLVSVTEDRQLATVLCAVINLAPPEVTITNAGHLPPLVIGNGSARYLPSEVGLPVGVDPATTYSSTMTSPLPGSTLLVFTDGLVERRGESIDAGLERLRSRVSPEHVGLDHLLDRVLDDMRHDSSDDTAVAAIRWMN